MKVIKSCNKAYFDGCTPEYKGRDNLLKESDDSLTEDDLLAITDSDVSLRAANLKNYPAKVFADGSIYKNIDYCEILENDECTESELYEIVNTRFLFVVFRPVKGRTITVHNNATGEDSTEECFVLDKAFFWTMPPDDIEAAKKYWEHIRKNVRDNNINLDAFWSISDRKKFHVRPKATNKAQLTVNPNGGICEKYCYWFNQDYIKSIIDSNN